MNKHEKGFSSLVIVFAVFIICLIAFVGFLLNERQSSQNSVSTTPGPTADGQNENTDSVTYTIDYNNTGIWNDGKPVGCTKMAGSKPIEEKTVALNDEAAFLLDAESKRLCVSKLNR